MDTALLEGLPVRVDVLAGIELDHLRSEELAVLEHREPPLGLGLAPGHDLGLERLAELDLLGQDHRFDDDLLRERQRSGHVVDVGAGILGRLGHREGIAGVLTPVGQEHEAIRLAGGRAGEGELERLRQVRAPKVVTPAPHR